jgi:hypothetical protein
MNTCMTLLLLFILVFGSSISLPAQLPTGVSLDFSVLGGRWAVEAAPEKAEPRLTGSLEIFTRPTEISIMRGMYPQLPLETYRIDGSSTDLGGGRIGSALLVADGIVFVTRRARQLPAGPSATIHTDFYQVDGDVLTVDSVRSQTRPDGTLSWMENTRVVIRYHRVR